MIAEPPEESSVSGKPRAGGIQNGQHSDPLPLRVELLGHLHRDEAPIGEAPQVIRTLRLRSPDLLEVTGRQLLDPGLAHIRLGKLRRLKPEDRLIWSQVL